MTTSLQIIKLTPPQIAAVHEALPGLTGLGVITSTNSIATFRVPEGVSIGRATNGDVWVPDVERVTRLIASAHERTGDRRLFPVLAKLRDAEAKHLRVTA